MRTRTESDEYSDGYDDEYDVDRSKEREREEGRKRREDEERGKRKIKKKWSPEERWIGGDLALSDLSLEILALLSVYRSLIFDLYL